MSQAPPSWRGALAGVAAMLGYRNHDRIRRPLDGLAPTIWARLALVMTFALCARPAIAQEPKINYDETKVPAYSLPDPLVLSGGERVGDAETWTKKRRSEVLRLFETHVYGKSPGR